MAANVEGIGLSVGGIAGATFTTADLARARVFYLARLGVPLVHDGGDAFTFRVGTSDITVCVEVDASMGAGEPETRRTIRERRSRQQRHRLSTGAPL